MVALPMSVSAETLITNYLEGELPAASDGPRFFDYQDAQQMLWDSTTDWNTGTFVDTTVSVAGGSVELAPSGPPFEVCINSGGPDFTGADGTFYQADAYATGGGTYYFPAGINNTTDDAMWQRIRYAFTAGGVPTYTYAIPVPNPGTYEVEVGIMESFNNPPYQNQTDLTIEGVQVLNAFDPYTTTGGRFNPTWHTFTTTTTNSTVDLLVGHDGWYGALTFVCVRELSAALATTGSWTSPVIDTSAAGTNIFGLIGAATTTPAGTDVQFQLSFGASATAALAGPFLGPDGTVTTTYDPNTPIAYAHDVTDRYVAVRALLTSSTSGLTPSLDTAWITWDLAELDTTVTNLTVASSPAGQIGWLVRVRADDATLGGSTGTISLLSSTGFGELEVGTDHPTTQVDIIAGVPVQSVGPAFAVGPATPHSIRLAETAMLGGTTAIRWQAEVDGVLVAHDFSLSFF